MSFFCAGVNSSHKDVSETFSFAHPIGIGLVQSAINLTRYCLMNPSLDSIVFVGSAGSYDKNLKIGDICLSTSAFNIESCFIKGECYTPLACHVALENLELKSLEPLNLPKLQVNSSNYITNIDSLNTAFINANIALENMEFFSVLSVAQSFNLPAFGIFGITNYVGKDAFSEFRTNHASIKKLLESFVQKEILDKRKQH
ncbi:purine-nucleoside phosphorylase [Helicobacter sp. 11S02629-2]|uniref:5'-methylthioadenosine/S-adenosylhomocysteine nucleosidase family protein n=1 Tax=Helicobacter sp. 11S02629-2 TaxID=1476195 RepID=UPI000BA77F26|nr:purine-nucleoside phosphorylase [Helicobacter sp. 11S02629-2]PAF45628.1 hypothetical protein BKH40_01740 [Helicobacter sp. 11S02629-2]